MNGKLPAIRAIGILGHCEYAALRGPRQIRKTTRLQELIASRD
ncbi:MAG: hypothetical protein WD793_03170 [Steroidobacteraceae bacterium]